MFSGFLLWMNEWMLVIVIFLTFLNRLEIFMECHIRGLPHIHKAAACMIEKYLFIHTRKKGLSLLLTRSNWLRKKMQITERNWIKVKLNWHTAVGVPHILVNPSKSALFNDDDDDDDYVKTYSRWPFAIRFESTCTIMWILILFMYREKYWENCKLCWTPSKTNHSGLWVFFSALSCILLEKIW